MNATHGTRWPRSIFAIGVGLAIVGVLTAMLSGNVLAATITFQDSPSQFSSSQIDGTDVGFGMVPITTAAGTKQVLRSGFANGRFDGLCVSQKQTIAGTTWTVRLEAGDGTLGSYDVAGSNAVFDVDNLKASTNGSGAGVNLDGRVQLGLTSDDITTVSGADNPFEAPTGTAGYWGIDADSGKLYALRGDIYNAIIGGPFSLPNLKIRVLPGDVGCDTIAIPQ